jgi:hypothetical protein
MQTLALENYGASELSFDEQKEIDGGLFPSFVSVAVIGQVYTEIREAFKDIVQGYEHCSKRLNNH